VRLSWVGEVAGEDNVRTSDVRSTPDSDVCKRAYKLLIELCSSSIRLLDRLRQPILCQWNVWASAGSLDTKSSAYLVDKGVLDELSLVQHSISDDSDAEKPGKVSHSLNVVQIHQILLKGLVEGGVRLVKRYNNVVNVDK
jgi:hypothetical protein